MEFLFAILVLCVYYDGGFVCIDMNWIWFIWIIVSLTVFLHSVCHSICSCVAFLLFLLIVSYIFLHTPFVVSIQFFIILVYKIGWSFFLARFHQWLYWCFIKCISLNCNSILTEDPAELRLFKKQSLILELPGKLCLGKFVIWLWYATTSYEY